MVAVENEGLIRFGFFLGVLSLMCALEVWKPFRVLKLTRLYRWPNNMGIVVLDTLLIKLVLPTTAVGFAIFVQSKGWGLFGYLQWPDALEIALAIVLLDLGIYWQHVAFHYIPVLWRVHSMHHTDTDFDVTTASRFHPIEILLSMLVKFWLILALGPAPLAVLIFEILLNATAMFNHSNISLPKSLDKVVRYLIVTPDMHRIHHSTLVSETNSNYGFNLTWWDRLFRSYTVQASRDPQTMPIGLEEFRDPKEAGLGRLLVQPFKKR